MTARTEGAPGAPDAQRDPRDVRMRGFRERGDVDDLLALIAQRLVPLEAEEVDPYGAAGRVLAASVRALIDVPSFDRSAMDGYAVKGEETFGAGPYNPIGFTVVGESFPGAAFLGTVASGQAVRIMTGAPMPAGADAVVMAEVTRIKMEAGVEHVEVSESVTPARHVGRRGEDVRAGDRILEQGRLLRPQDAGLLAATGHSLIPVVRRPRVGLLVTGNEVTPPGQPRPSDAIFDANSPMLAALIARDGGELAALVRVADNRQAVRAALAELAATTDLVITSGGSSVGTEDHLPMLLAELGELACHGVALRPASPTGFGFIGACAVALLPGNPVSCLCAYELFAGRALRRLAGRSLELPHRRARFPLARKIASAIGRVDYVRVRLENGRADPLATSGASILSSTTRADGFVLIARDSEGVAAGEPVEVYLY